MTETDRNGVLIKSSESLIFDKLNLSCYKNTSNNIFCLFSARVIYWYIVACYCREICILKVIYRGHNSVRFFVFKIQRRFSVLAF